MPKPGNSKQRDKAFQHRIVSQIWINIALFELIFLYGIVFFRFYTFFGWVIIADRYLWDTLIDFELRFKDFKIENLIFWKILVLISPCPNHSFIITISNEESLRRSNLKNEPFSESLKERKKGPISIKI